MTCGWFRPRRGRRRGRSNSALTATAKGPPQSLAHNRAGPRSVCDSEGVVRTDRKHEVGLVVEVGCERRVCFRQGLDRKHAPPPPSLRATLAHAVDLRQHAQLLGLKRCARVEYSAEPCVRVDLCGPSGPALRDASGGQWWRSSSSS